MSLFNELKRRNVIRVAVAYLVVSWLVLQVADVVFPALKLPEWSITLVTVMLGLGFVVALVFSWIFELTPEGLVRDSGEGSHSYATRKLDIATIAAAVLVVAVTVWDRGTDAPTPEAADPSAPHELSIAVLPFVNMSADADNEYFADGLSEELLNVLAKIEDFKVAGRTSSFAFKGQDQDLRIIGEKLDVATVLEGSVRKSGDRVRITAQLVKTDDGYHLWSETYDRELDDIFAIQDDIAGQVVAALKTTLLGEDQATIADSTSTTNVEAYQHLLRARSIIKTRAKDDLERALDELSAALAIDPDYALAHAVRAETLWHLISYGYWPLGQGEAELAKSVERALESAPRLPEAHAARFMLLDVRNAPQDERIASLERAVELNPNYALARMWLANNLGNVGEAERAFEQNSRAVALDPLHPVILKNQFRRAATSGRSEEAERMLAALESLDPGGHDVLDAEATMGWITADVPRQIRPLVGILESDPDDVSSLALLATIAMSLGDTAAATGWAERGLAVNPENATLHNILLRVAMFRGDREAARARFEHLRSVAGTEAGALAHFLEASITFEGAATAWGYCEDALGIDGVPETETDWPELAGGFDFWGCTLALRNMGEDEAADTVVRLALEAFDDRRGNIPETQLLQSRYFLENNAGHRDEAVALMRRLLELKPDYPLARYRSLELPAPQVTRMLYGEDAELTDLVDRLNENAMAVRRELAAEGILNPPEDDE